MKVHVPCHLDACAYLICRGALVLDTNPDTGVHTARADYRTILATGRRRARRHIGRALRRDWLPPRIFTFTNCKETTE